MRSNGIKAECKMYEVVVVGGGVSGLTCATFLADAGLNVAVLEASQKIGGFMKDNLQGFLSYEIDKTPFNIPRDKPSKKIALWSPNKNRVEFEFDKPICYLVKRGPTDSFELYLAKKARAAGAEIVTNSRITKLRWTGNCINEILDTNGQSYRGKVFVAADGIASRMRKLAGVGILPPKGVGFGLKMANVKIAPLEMHGMFNLRLAPQGYCYVIGYPDGKYASVVVSARVRYIQKNIREYFSHFIKSYPELFRDAERIHGFARAVTCNDGGYKLRRGNLLFVGEAGGFQDPMFGFGMSPSIRSSKIAANIIIQSLNKNQNSILANYEAIARDRILRGYVRGRWNLRKLILEHMNNDDLEVLFESAGANKKVIRKVIQTGNFYSLFRLFPSALLARPQLGRFLLYALYTWLPFQI